MTHRPPTIHKCFFNLEPLDDSPTSQVPASVQPSLRATSLPPLTTAHPQRPYVSIQQTPRGASRKCPPILALSLIGSALIGSALYGVSTQQPAIAQSITRLNSSPKESGTLSADVERIAPAVTRGLRHKQQPQLQANQQSATSNENDASSSQPKPSPWGRPYTGSGTSTDARSGCAGLDAPLVALVPDTNFGRSLSITPTLWFYVPQNSGLLSAGSFSLVDENYNDVFAPLDFTLDDASGFVGVRLPKAVSLLEPNKPYHWYFELFCEDSSSVLSVDGWIEQATLDEQGIDERSTPEQGIEQSLESSSLHPYAYYRNHFIWFDAFDIMLQEWRDTHSNDAEEELLSLLQSANVALDEWSTDARFTLLQWDIDPVSP